VDFALVLLLQILYAIASLALISVGLAVIFGMMRVINFAHGEFLMRGGYAFIETVLATWGLSLFLIGLAASIFGYVPRSVAPPFGSLTIGLYREGGYTFFVIAVALVVVTGTYCFLRFSRFGLFARATMQKPDMAASLGVDTDRIYATTFGIGAALSGLAGAVLAPIAGVVPIVGGTYIAKSFITVIVGGATALVGTTASAVLLGTVNQLAANISTPVIGEVALLSAAVILLRLLPEGITGKYFRGGL
jgi:branched-subunit amino acid ABC-type transport system permease component